MCCRSSSRLSALLVVFGLSAAPLEAGDTLRSLAESKGKLIGAAVASSYLKRPDATSPAYREAVKREFNLLVPENSFKMSYLLPRRPADPFRVRVSDLDTAPIDRLMERARENGGQKIRGHVLIWHQQAPEWLVQEAPRWSSGQITAFATSYITAVLSHCRTKAPLIHEWDVVNEAIDGKPAAWRKGTWYDGVADRREFIDACFRAARAAHPTVRLFYNDYGIELHNRGTKNAFVLEMAAGMVARKVPIDGIGLQCHFDGPDAAGQGGFTGEDARDFAETFEKLRELGLDALVTELDLALSTDSKTGEGKVTPEQLAAQGRQYELIAFTALSRPNCPSLLTWGFTDAHSWIPKFRPGKGHALLLDHAYQRKPAYRGLENALGKVR